MVRIKIKPSAVRSTSKKRVRTKLPKRPSASLTIRLSKAQLHQQERELTEAIAQGKSTERGKIDLYNLKRFRGYGLVDKDIAYLLRIAEPTFYAYLRDPIVKRAYDEGILEPITRIVSRLYALAEAGNMDAIKYVLRNRMPHLWGAIESKAHVTVNQDNRSVNVEKADLDLSLLTLEELKVMRTLTEKARKKKEITVEEKEDV